MKKIIILIIVVIAAAIPGVPYYIGTTVEATFHAEHQEMAQQAALSGYDIELVDYQRQLFAASATSRITIALPEGKEAVTFELQHQISHIPQLAERIIANVDSKLVLNSESAAAIAPLFKGQPPLSIHTAVFLDGHQEGSLHSPAASGTLNNDDKTALEWQGLEGSVWQSVARDQVKLQMDMPGLTLRSTVADSAEQVTIAEIHYEAEMQRAPSSMWQGTGNMVIAAMEGNFRDPDGQNITMSMDAFKMRAEQEEHEGMTRLAAVMQSKRLNINGFELTDAIYDFSVDNIQTEAMMGLQTALQSMAKDQSKPADPMEPLRAHLPALFNAQPVIKVNDLSVNSPMGRFALKLDTSITGQWNDTIMNNPAILAGMVRANVDASVPRNVAVSALEGKMRIAVITQSDGEMSGEEMEAAIQQRVSQQLQGLISQGYIKENETQLETRIEYNAGQMTINGMDASALVGALM